MAGVAGGSVEKIDVKKSLGLFRDLLNVSWPTVTAFERCDEFGNFKIDWLQGNWELTVEQSLLQGLDFLQIYGEGADCNGASSRVLYPEKMATHRVVCHLKQDAILLSGALNCANPSSNSTSIILDSFVTMTEAGWFEEAPPFDCVIADHGSIQVLFKFEDAEFSLEEIEKPLRAD